MGDGGPELYYMRNRWYEPRTGRFLREDPIGLAGGINPYVFAGNEPVSGRDPTGLGPCEDGAAGYETGYYVFEETPGGVVDGKLYWVATGWVQCPESDRKGIGSPTETTYLGHRLSVGSGPTLNPPQEQACRAVVLELAFSAATDALFFTGVGAVAKGARIGAIAARGGSKASVRAADALERIAMQRVRSGGRVRQMAGGVGASTTGFVMGASESTLLGADWPWWRVAVSFVPLVGTGFAAWDTWKAC